MKAGNSANQCVQIELQQVRSHFFLGDGFGRTVDSQIEREEEKQSTILSPIDPHQGLENICRLNLAFHLDLV